MSWLSEAALVNAVHEVGHTLRVPNKPALEVWNAHPARDQFFNDLPDVYRLGHGSPQNARIAVSDYSRMVARKSTGGPTSPDWLVEFGKRKVLLPENTWLFALTGGRGGFRTDGRLCVRQNNPTGKFSLSPSGKSLLRLTPSCPRGRGVGHRHRTLGWDVVDAAASGVKFVRRAGFRERMTARRT
jgi:hypothetical protein